MCTPCAFWHPVRDVRTAVRGNNFASLGARADLDWLEKELSKECAVKVEGMFGPPGEPDCAHSVCALNRLLTWTAKGIERESDPRRVQILLRELSVAESGKSATTPGVKEKPAEADEDDIQLPMDERAN
jgi:signal transduction histidine kinase